MTPLLRRSSRRYLLHHPWRLGLSIVGIAVAVAVVTGVDLASSSAERAFTLSVEAVAGRATHRIAAGPAGVEEGLYTRLRTELGLRLASPVVEVPLTTPLLPGRSLRLLGIDPFAEPPFRSLTAAVASSGDLGAFLTRPGAVAIGEELAAELGLEPGADWRAAIGGRERELTVVALLRPADELARRSARDLVVADVATAQELVDRPGRLSRIDLALGTGSEAERRLERLRAWLPETVRLERAAARGEALEQMTRAFRLNLEALSLLALLVGAFLIYNTMSFSVVERRELLGMLRTLGATRRELLALVLFEAAALGSVGTLLGIAAGTLLAGGLLDLMVRTINDLYFVLSVTGVDLAPASLAKAFALGLGATLAAAFLPAREAAGAVPRSVLSRSALESRTRERVARLAWAGLFLVVAGALLLLPGRGLPLGFAAVFASILGFACWVAPATLLALRLLGRLPLPGGVLGRMAVRGVGANLSRTAVALSALVVAVATTLGIALMIGSFRATLVDWLEITLQADLYVSPASLDGRGRGADLDPEIVAGAAELAGIAHVSTYRRVRVPVAGGSVQMTALGSDRRAFEIFDFAEGSRERAWEAFASGRAVLVSEPLAYRRRLGVGDELELLTPEGPRAFPIAGVFYDYGSDQGVVMLERRAYERLWDDPKVHSLGLYARPGFELDTLVRKVEALAAGRQAVRVLSNRDLRRAALEIFDRTFLITRVLRVLAVLVSVIGVLTALMALQLERSRELGVLRATGLTPAQVWGLISAETGLMGLLAGLFSLPLGLAMAGLLIRVINLRSFGWTLYLELPPAAFAQGVGLALGAALLAGLYPAWRMSRTSPAEALREE